LGAIGLGMIFPGAALTVMGAGVGVTILADDVDDPGANAMALGLAGAGLLLVGGGATLMVLDAGDDTTVAVGPTSVAVAGRF
jgi:hypothetical protein